MAALGQVGKERAGGTKVNRASEETSYQFF